MNGGRLWLLRHGRLDASGAPIGWRDDPPGEAARPSWPGLRAALLALGAERVLSSDLRRTREPAADLGLPHLILPGLREQSFGAWEGLRWQDNPAARDFLAEPVHAVPPGGESFAACAARAEAALAGAWDGRPTLVLAHAGSLRAILGAWLGLDLARRLDLAWDHDGLTCLEVYAHGRAVLRFHNQPPAR